MPGSMGGTVLGTEVEGGLSEKREEVGEKGG